MNNSLIVLNFIFFILVKENILVDKEEQKWFTIFFFK